MFYPLVPISIPKYESGLSLGFISDGFHLISGSKNTLVDQVNELAASPTIPASSLPSPISRPPAMMWSGARVACGRLLDSGNGCQSLTGGHSIAGHLFWDKFDDLGLVVP
jgi:hypothetical protein